MDDIKKLMDDLDVVDDILIEWFEKRMEIVDKMIAYWKANPFDQIQERELETVLRKHYRSVNPKYGAEYMYFQTYLLKIAKDHKEALEKKEAEENQQKEISDDEENSDNV